MLKVRKDGVRVFVASTPSEWLAAKVLEFSILEHCSCLVSVYPIYTFNRPIKVPALPENKARTPFSFQRFLIPELCNYSGKAIYLDSDMQVFKDIKELWDIDLSYSPIQIVKNVHHARKRQFSVMLMDCKKLLWNVDHIVSMLDKREITYEELMYELKLAANVLEEIPSEWNSLEYFNEHRTCLLHYTDMNSQPWVSSSNPLGYLWVSCLRRALIKGFIKKSELIREVELGHVRPSLLQQIDAGIDNAFTLSRFQKRLDKEFVAPYKKKSLFKASPWKGLVNLLMQKFKL